jgi:uncharacterized membrane protein
MHFDLVPSIVGTMPTAAIATVKVKDAITVDLTNTGGSTINGGYTLTLLLSADQTLDGSDTQIVAVTKNLPSLKAGANRSLVVKIGDFPDVTNGNYFILAEVTGTLAGASDNVAATAGEIAITDPFVDLSDTVVYAGASSVKPGKKANVAVTVTNSGNVPAKGSLLIDLAYSVNADGSAAVSDGSISANINIAPNKSKVVKFPKTVPIGTTPGNYYTVTTVDPGNTFSESNVGNNTAVTPTALTVLGLYPDITGSWTGSYRGLTGQDKGETGPIDVDFTEDDATGTLSGPGSSDGNFTVAGSIQASGALTMTFTFNQSGHVVDNKGKLSHGVISGKYTEDTGTGTFTLSMT